MFWGLFFDYDSGGVPESWEYPLKWLVYNGLSLDGVFHGKSILWMDDLPSGKLTWLLKIAIEIADLPIKNSDFP